MDTINRKTGFDCPIFRDNEIGNLNCQDCGLLVEYIGNHVTCIDVKKITKYVYGGNEYGSIEAIKEELVTDEVNDEWYNGYNNQAHFLDNNKELVEKYYKLTK